MVLSYRDINLHQIIMHLRMIVNQIFPWKCFLNTDFISEVFYFQYARFYPKKFSDQAHSLGKKIFTFNAKVVHHHFDFYQPWHDSLNASMSSRWHNHTFRETFILKCFHEQNCYLLNISQRKLVLLSLFIIFAKNTCYYMLLNY